MKQSRSKVSNDRGSLPERIRAVARTIGERGGRALLVGGYVRDELLGMQPKDADIEVYGLAAEEVRRVLERLGRVGCVGESFRVYKLAWRDSKGQRHELDVSLPRRDKKIGAGHRGFEVEGDPHASVEDAARRRDFTINAILRDPLTDEILDPFGGRRDLEKKLLKVVDPAHFAEDSLRVLRAAQFAARFDLEIEEETVALCRTIDLSDLPRERVWGEWEKLLLKSGAPSRGFRVAQQLGILEKLFPYLEVALERRGDEFYNTVDRAAREKSALDYPRQVVLMLAAVGIFIGWGSKSDDGVLKWLDDLHIFTIDGYDVRRNVQLLVGERKRVSDWYRQRDEIEDKEFRFLSARVEPRLIYFLTRGRGEVEAAEWFLQRMEALEVADGPPPALLMGRHLIAMGMKPGPRMGQILQRVYFRQLEGAVTDFEAAEALARELMETDDEGSSDRETST